MKHKIIKCKYCKRKLPLYEIVCVCGRFTMEKVATPPADGSAFYWRHIAMKADIQKRDKNNNELNEPDSFKKAVKAYSKAIALEENVKDYLKRGFIYGLLRKHNEAVKDLKQCIKLEPENPAYKGLLMWMKAEHKFYKNNLRLKPIAKAMMKKQKIKIEDLEVDDYNERVFQFTDAKGKKAVFSVTRDTLASYDGRTWF
ncbi:MAG: tetratricopeptide repeat protein [Bacteroidia bacterium]|nr:tetratricopeptide repeat protein [Bacteroidia bacterium]